MCVRYGGMGCGGVGGWGGVGGMEGELRLMTIET